MNHYNEVLSSFSFHVDLIKASQRTVLYQYPFLNGWVSITRVSMKVSLKSLKMQIIANTVKSIIYLIYFSAISKSYTNDMF